ncbi:hypothetical protein BAU18_000074 [Enterococcus diestrammenae]|uniref:Uncharacterized protein n=1 Tax=Enterococcus diestrammenae TaxID=1155073 RepID=A0ABV0EXV6_9ENTE
MEKLDTFKERRAFRQWLEEHGTKTEGGGFVLAKKGAQLP